MPSYREMFPQFADKFRAPSHCIGDAPRSPGPFAFYYVRVEAQDGQVARSSPVWLAF